MLLPSGLSLDQRQSILGRFKSGEGKLLVANPASAGHGITLTNCSNVIYYSRLFNYEHRAQSEARVHRIGQTEACLYTDLLDPDTLERKVVHILRARERMSEFMLDGKFLRQLLSDEPMELEKEPADA
jgi:SNF2 family DNA or RNA helicase